MKSQPQKTMRPVVLCLSIIVFSLCFLSTNGMAAKPDYVYFSIDGDTTLAVMAQGDLFGWGCNCDSGATINWEIWCDLNDNSTIDPSTDFPISSENMADGDPLTEADAVLDGWIVSDQFLLGAAAGQYIFKATDVETDVTTQKIVTVNAMVSPPSQLSGQITIPGYAPPNSFLADRIVYSESEAVPGAFFARTDINGQYAINIVADGVDQLFYLTALDIPGFIVTADTTATATGVVTGLDFTYTAATDSVWGYVRDDMGGIVNIEGSVYMQQTDPPFVERDVNTVDGRYVLYFSGTDGGNWEMNTHNFEPVFLSSYAVQFNVDTLSSFQHDFILNPADSRIYARITEDGSPAAHRYLIDAFSENLFAWTNAVSGTGVDNIATLKVSSLDPSGWSISIRTFDDLFPLPSGLFPVGYAANVSPGDTVTLNLTSSFGCCGEMRGNANGDPEDKLNITDITYLIQYLFGVPNGPAPPCTEEGNANGDPEEKINVTDITYLVQHLFGVPNGPAPPNCP